MTVESSFQYCARCGTRLVFGPVEGRDREHCPACGYVVYHNPAPVGMAVVEHGVYSQADVKYGVLQEVTAPWREAPRR